MTMPISERVFTAIIEQLRTIQPENDYHTTLGSNVVRARRAFDPVELPAIGVWDGGETPDPQTGSGRERALLITQAIDLVLHAPADQADTGEIVGLLKADVKRCLLSWAASGSIVDCLEQKIALLTYVSAEPLSREDSGSSESVLMRFTARYKEKFGDPTTDN